MSAGPESVGAGVAATVVGYLRHRCLGGGLLHLGTLCRSRLFRSRLLGSSDRGRGSGRLGGLLLGDRHSELPLDLRLLRLELAFHLLGLAQECDRLLLCLLRVRLLSLQHLLANAKPCPVRAQLVEHDGHVTGDQVPVDGLRLGRSVARGE